MTKETAVVIDTSVWLGAASSVVSPTNREFDVIRGVADNPYQKIYTCQPQRIEFFRNLGETRFREKDFQHPSATQEIRTVFGAAQTVSVTTDPHEARYGKDAFVPALLSVLDRPCVLYTRDDKMVRRVRKDFSYVTVIDLNSPT